MAACASTWAIALRHGSHLVADLIDSVYVEHVPAQPQWIGRHHDMAADDAGLIDAGLPLFLWHLSSPPVLNECCYRRHGSDSSDHWGGGIPSTALQKVLPQALGPVV